MVERPIIHGNARKVDSDSHSNDNVIHIKNFCLTVMYMMVKPINVSLFNLIGEKMLKLEIELIPSTAWFNNIRNMVSRSAWDTIRKECYAKANHKCEICGGKGRKWPVECHERWEFSDNKINLLGFIALCPSCHEVKHIGLAGKRGRYEQAKRHFMKVNGLSSLDADKHIFEAFQLFSERSKHEWEMNLELIEQYLK